MLSLHQIELDAKDKSYIQKTFGNGDKIKYKEAVAAVVIDLDYAGLEQIKWTVQRPNDNKNNADNISRVTSKALSRLGGQS